MIGNKIAAVLEFGTSKVTIMACKLNKESGYTVISTCSAAYSGYYKGKFIDSFNELFVIVKNLIVNAQNQSRFKFKEIYVGANAAFTVLANSQVSLTFNESRTITSADTVKLFKKANNFDDTKGYTLIDAVAYEYIVDGEKCESIENKTATSIGGEFSFIFVENSFISKVEKLLSSLGLKMKGLISVEKAQSEFILTKQQRSKVPILVDIGAGSATVTVCVNSGFAVMENIYDGGAYITEDLCDVLNLDFETAETLKGKVNLNLHCGDFDYYNVNGKTIQCKTVNDIIIARIEAISDKIAAIVENVSNRLINETEMYLTGGALTHIKGAIALLSESLGGIKITSPTETGLQLYKPEDTAAYSLLDIAAKKVLEKENTFINLLIM
ncbi:MAG: hypothetical protein RR054_04075 [Clostridia bacterium]